MFRFIIFLIAFAVSSIQGLQYCDNDCKTGDGYFCTKDNPAGFSICSGGARLGTLYCQTGLHFDITQNACNWPSLITGEQCPCIIPTTPPSTTPGPTTTTTTTQRTGPPPSTRPPAPEGLKRVCYFTNWSVYRKGAGKYTADNVDPFMCTHIIVAFMHLQNSIISYLEDGDAATLQTLTTLRDTRNPALKILIAIGGWDAGSAPFIDVVKDVASEEKFINQAISFMREHDLDGLDVDWEYPTGHISKFSSWLARIRRAFENEAAATGLNQLLLTAAVSAGTGTINNAYDVPTVSNLLDFINLMSYDLNGAWNPSTGLNSAISGGEPFSVQYAAGYWVGKGADRSKIIIGIPTYGRTFKLCDTEQTGIGARACGAGQKGLITVSAGFEAYYESCLKLQCEAGGWTTVWNEQGQVPFMYSSNQWITYENATSIAAKVEFAKENNYGGVMVWALDLDDFNDVCGSGVKSPLMSTLVAAATNQPLPTFNAVPKPDVDPCDPLGTGETGEIGGGSTSGLEICDNNCAVTGLYCVPDSPTQFYQCVNTVRYGLQDCQEGLMFNYMTQTCDWPANYPGCNCDLSSTTTAAAKRLDLNWLRKKFEKYDGYPAVRSRTW